MDCDKYHRERADFSNSCGVLWTLFNTALLSTAYGFLEILIGMFVIIGTIGREPELVDPSLLLVQVAAGMYVIIRGFDNFVQSDPFAGGEAAFRALWNLVKALRLRRRKTD
jgi:hypothetical protein